MEDMEDEEESGSGPMVSLFSGAVGLRTFPSAQVTDNGPYVRVTDAHDDQAIVKKSALVWMLNSRGQLSNDRTTRVREGEGN